VTCVVGIASAGQVLLGGDSGVLDDTYRFQGKTLKVRRVRKGLVVGAAGPWRALTVALYGTDWPNDDDRPVFEWALEEVVPAISSALVRGAVETEDYPEIILGVRGRIVMIDESLGPYEPADRWCAIGNGGPVALGSLAETVRLQPRTRAKRALEAATRYTHHVFPPYHYVRG
jgi:ATP-dependent protease HslVU (ClpYQ) peptidase subunit